MSIAQPVAPGAIVADSNDPNRRTGRVLSPAQAAGAGLLVDDDMFVINSGTEDDPWFTFGRLTGRTRRQWGIAMLTIDRFEVVTTVRDTLMSDGEVHPSLWGVPAPERMIGTWMTRPENIT